MDEAAIELTAGVLLALGFIVLARWLGREARLYGVGLAVAAAIYLAASAIAGAPGDLGIEAFGLAAFGLAGVLGLRGRAWLLATGWALHAAWDVALHTGGRGAFMPAWYPVLCVGFDLLLAGYLLHRALPARGGAGA